MIHGLPFRILFAALITSSKRYWYISTERRSGYRLGDVCPHHCYPVASHVPKVLPAERIQKTLGSCDRETGIGKRDYALLILPARLGLRAGEVVVLESEDFDWDAGLITAHGKGKRVAQMLLSSEVGAAIADYLSTGRIVPAVAHSSGRKRRQPGSRTRWRLPSVPP
jgi:integrase